MAINSIRLDAQTVEAIARRVVALLPQGVSARVELVDATELARRLGIERSWVYTHAIELGVIRLGSGDRPRLRFDPQVAITRIRARAQESAADAPRRPAGEGVERPRLLPINRGGAN